MSERENDMAANAPDKTAAESAVATVKRWMVKRGYSTGGGDNIGYVLTNLEAQIWERMRAADARGKQ